MDDDNDDVYTFYTYAFVVPNNLFCGTLSTLRLTFLAHFVRTDHIFVLILLQKHKIHLTLDNNYGYDLDWMSVP